MRQAGSIGSFCYKPKDGRTDVTASARWYDQLARRCFPIPNCARTPRGLVNEIKFIDWGTYSVYLICLVGWLMAKDQRATPYRSNCDSI